MFMSRSDPNNELTPDLASQFDSSLDEWQSFLGDFIGERRKAPREDLATALIQFGDQEDRLSTAELVSNFVLFMGAGHETTTSLLGNTIHALLTHPDQMQEVRQMRRLVPAAIEETLRWENPVQRLRRTAARDFVLHNQPIRQGDSVELVPGSANRDPAHFEDAHVFDIHRDSVDHLSFGKGIHFCVGARLARDEAGIALNAIFDRFSRLQLTERWRPDWKRSSLLRRLETLKDLGHPITRFLGPPLVAHPQDVDDLTKRSDLLRVPLGHLALVCGKCRQNLLLLTLGHLEEVECAPKFRRDFIELGG